MQRRRVLVVDDNRLLRDLVCSALRDMAQVESAASGEEALALLLRDPAFDLVLCDLHMPGMSGIALHALLTHKLPALASRVVLMTADERIVPGIRLVHKPASPDVLRALLDDAPSRLA